MSLHRRIILSSDTNGPDLYPYSSSPPLPNLLSDSSTAVPVQRHISNAAIAAVSSVSAAIFLALTYYSVLRHRRRRLLSNPSDESYSSAGDETSDDDGGGGAHHVWNIRTVGLDTSAILSIGSYAYLPPSCTDTDTDTATADCPVCLGELEDGDMVRLLPKCGHVFHVPCIDTWLCAHVTCPLCRVHILPPPAEGADGEARVRVLSDTEAPPSPPPPPEDDPESPIDHRSVTTETEMEERGGEERKDDYSGEGSSKEIEVPSASGSGRVFLFARMSRGRSSSILPL